jgi:threonine/homoserine/homoserine lactone efflux protein
MPALAWPMPADPTSGRHDVPEVGVSGYLSFVGLAVLLILIPGPDFAVVTKNTLAGGRRSGRWTAVGIASGAFVQGSLAAAGLGALVLRAEPVFQAIRWAGVGYLAWLGAQSLVSAIRGRYADPAGRAEHRAGRGFRQGFLSNVTNPKVLVFYLAVLPQFLPRSPTVPVLLAYAWTHALLGLGYLLLLTAALHRLSIWLRRHPVRRVLDAATGVALLGFGPRLATSR